jgi:hypothetical protein
MGVVDVSLYGVGVREQENEFNWVITQRHVIKKERREWMYLPAS